MAYDEEFAHRLRQQLAGEAGRQHLEHREADGPGRPGRDGRCARAPHARQFDMTGRPMKSWILVAPEGVKTERQLGDWVSRGVEFAGTLPPKG
jgi:hypothetical protein